MNPRIFIRTSDIGEISADVMQNSALSLRILLQAPILGGVIREAQAELRHKPTDFIKTEEIGRRPLVFSDEFRPESTDLAKAANNGWRRPRSQAEFRHAPNVSVKPSYIGGGGPKIW